MSSEDQASDLGEVLLLYLSIFRSTAGIRLFVKPRWFRILRGEIDE